MSAPAVVLVTDFGWSDPWVAEMKGVLLTAWARWPAAVPRPVLVDGGHDVPRGDVEAGAWFLGRLVPRYPAGTVFLAVVDPGVGTGRPAVACAAAGRWCVGPGNGLLAGVATGRPVLLPAPGPGSSATFHGRDVFAPAAARLALAQDAALVGAPGEAADLGPAPDGAAAPRVRWIDRFGNAVSDLARESAAGRALAAGGELRAGADAVDGPWRTFGEAPAGRPFWYWGSGGTVEIGVPGGRADEHLPLVRGLVLSVATP